MTLLDLALVLVIVLAALSGWRAGAAGQAGTLLGALVGFVVGGAVAPAVVDAVDLPGRGWLVWVGVVVVSVAIGVAVGSRVGATIGRGIGAVGLGVVDRGLGAVLRVGVALVVCWLLAGVAVAVGSPSVDRSVRASSVLQAVDRNLPDLPAEWKAHSRPGV